MPQRRPLRFTLFPYTTLFRSRPITNATQALGGKATGVWVSQNSGKPGEDGAQLRVRGWGTMNNANPLVIIDRKSTRLNSSHVASSYAVFCLKKKSNE